MIMSFKVSLLNLGTFLVRLNGKLTISGPHPELLINNRISLPLSLLFNSLKINLT